MSKYLVAIDAGHGMTTGGKRSVKLSSDLYVNGVLVRKKGEIIKENEWNRAISEYLAKALTRCRIGYMYTADMTGKTDVPLATRSYRANKAGADILISNHYNAAGTATVWQTKVKGLLVLRTKNCSSKSITLGKLAVKHLAADIDYEYNYGLMRDVDMSGFTLAILRQTNMPAILIEYGFMDYEKEAKLMLNPSHQEKCAEAVCKAVCEYFGIAYIEDKNKESNKILYVKIKEYINMHNKPDFTSKSVIGIVPAGGVYTVIEEVKRSDTNMYRLKSGVYITASPKYVETFKK